LYSPFSLRYVRSGEKREEERERKKERTNQPMEVLGLFFSFFFFFSFWMRSRTMTFTASRSARVSWLGTFKTPQASLSLSLSCWCVLLGTLSFLVFIFYFIPKMQRVPR
jgi:hypothetical protein